MNKVKNKTKAVLDIAQSILANPNIVNHDLHKLSMNDMNIIAWKAEYIVDKIISRNGEID